MTMIINTQVNGPALHAFVIGVGHYRHLPDGADPVSAKTFGLQQVTTPPLSVRAVLDWLTNDYPHPESPPVGSIELLMSVDGGFAYDGNLVDGATLPNVQSAVNDWFQRCDSHADNVALFYFCGHGLERDKQYLLLEDFGQLPLNPLAMSVDLDRFHDGMVACRADTQIFIADACREVPWDLLKMGNGLGDPLLPPILGGNTDRNAPILRAAAQGQSAFGVPGQVTHFTQALLRALRGAGASEEPDNSDHWTVRYFRLVGAVQRLLADGPPEMNRQQCRTGGEAGDVILAHLPGPPEVTVQIDCVPADVAELELSSELRKVTQSWEPSAVSWRLEVPADYAYRLAAAYVDGRYPAWYRFVPVLPPLFRLSVGETP